MIFFPPYTPSDVSLRLPSHPVIPNSWRSTEVPEITGSIPVGAELRLTYRNVTDGRALELLLCWRATAGGAFPFLTLPAEVAAGVENAALARRITTPTPLVWALAEPPRQSSAKAGRSTVEVFLRTELRFNLILTGPPAPEPPDVPEMWVSRFAENIANNAIFPASVCVCPDGFSYQVSYMRTEADASNTRVLIVFRDPLGVVVWQRRINGLYLEGSSSQPLDRWWNLAIGKDDELFVIPQLEYWHRISLEVAGGTSIGDNTNFKAFCIERNGNLRWQKRYAPSNVRRSNGTVWKSAPEHTIKSCAYEPEADSLVLVLGTGGGSSPNNGPFFGIILISPATGDVLNSRVFLVESVASVSPNQVDECWVVIRNSRFFLFAALWNSGSFISYPIVLEISLNLQTIFSARSFQGIRFWQAAPAADGGWWLLGRTGTGTSRLQAHKYSSSFQPVARQVGQSESFIAANNRMAERIKVVDGQYVYTTSHDRDGSLIDSWTVIPRTKNFGGAEQAGSSVVFFDHDSSRAGSKIVTMTPQNTFFEPSDHGASFASDFYCQFTDSVVSTTGLVPSRPQGGRLVASGYKATLPDEGERWMDVGTSIASTFVAIARAQNDGLFNQLAESSAPDDLYFASNLPLDNTTHDITFEDLDFGYDEGSYAFAYYSYRDPEFIAPAGEGQSGIAFYTGNSAVQQIGVGAQFTPAFILHANRAGGPNVIKWASNLARNSQMRWGVSVITTPVSGDNYLHGTGEGFFKISGRDTSPNWNLIGNDYVAIALAAVAGGYEAVTYTGNGSSPRAISHSLGDTPEFMFVRAGSTTEPAGGSLIGSGNMVNMRGTAARVADSGRIAAVGPANFTVGASLNASGTVYYAYLFRSCSGWDFGTYAGDGSVPETVVLGYQPKAFIVKGIIGSTSNWTLYYRPDGTPGLCQFMALNTTGAEGTSSGVSITADGFTIGPGFVGNTGSGTALYWALR